MCASRARAASRTRASSCSAGKHRVNLGGYPEVGLAAARTLALNLIEQAKRGVNPKAAMGQNATVGGLTVRALSENYLKDMSVRDTLIR